MRFRSGKPVERVEEEFGLGGGIRGTEGPGVDVNA